MQCRETQWGTSSHSSFQQSFTEHLLCTRLWGQSSDQNSLKSQSCGAYMSSWEKTNKQIKCVIYQTVLSVIKKMGQEEAHPTPRISSAATRWNVKQTLPILALSPAFPGDSSDLFFASSDFSLIDRDSWSWKLLPFCLAHSPWCLYEAPCV